MSIIFDQFPSMQKAEAFVAAVKTRYGLDGQTFATHDKSDRHDPFPFELIPPIAHVDRSDDAAVEGEVEKLVGEYGGSFAGT